MWDIVVLVPERLEPLFIDGSCGQLFCLWASEGSSSSDEFFYYSPHRAIPSLEEGQHIVLFLPLFGEEVNLCRRFYSLVRNRLTMQGNLTLQPDLFGTGDSAGSLNQATWTQWQDDLRTVVRHMVGACSESSQRTRVSIIAVRSGCLMTQYVIELLEEQKQILAIENLVLVEPETHGEHIVNRLFRAQVFAQRLSGDKSQNTQDLWALIESGKDVQAGGHLLSAELCQSLCKQSIDSVLNTSAGKYRTWFNLQITQDSSVVTPPQSNSWNTNSIACMPFWQSYDIEPEEALLKAVVDALVR